MSIVDAIKNQLSGELLGKLSSVIGESEEKTRVAAGAAVPSLLSLLANSALSGKGLDGLLNALRGYEGKDPVAGLKSSTGAEGAAEAPPDGDVLGTLLGPNLSTLLGILSKFAGVGMPAIKTLLSYLGPIILSTIAAQLKGRGGLTPANLTSFFTAEKASITSALPAGLSLADLASPLKVPTSAHIPKAAEPGAPSWLFPVLALGLLGLAGWYFMRSAPEVPAPEPGPGSEVETTEKPPGDAPLPAPAPVDSPVAIPTADEVTKGLNEVYAGTTQALVDVKDVATAEAAAPKLSALELKLDAIKPLWDKIPAEAKSAVLKATAENLDALKVLIAKVLEIPGVGEKLKPILDGLLGKLAGLSV